MKRSSGDYNFSVKTKKYGDEIEYIVIFDDFPNLIGAGDTVEEAIQEARENLSAYINYCHENSISLPEPTNFEFKQNVFSGKVTLRMSKALHEKASIYADKEGVSLNAFINEAISNYMADLEKHSFANVLEYYKKIIPDSAISFIYMADVDQNKTNWNVAWKSKQVSTNEFLDRDLMNGEVMAVPSV